jgi:hypothetical protein
MRVSGLRAGPNRAIVARSDGSSEGQLPYIRSTGGGNRRLTAILLAALLFQGSTQAAEISPCAARPGTFLKYVEIFDGPPEELASLAPDESGKNSATFVLGDLYAAGRFAIVRCKYADGKTVDVKLTAKVESCKYVIGKGEQESFTCR